MSCQLWVWVPESLAGMRIKVIRAISAAKDDAANFGNPDVDMCLHMYAS